MIGCGLVGGPGGGSNRRVGQVTFLLGDTVLACAKL